MGIRALLALAAAAALAGCQQVPPGGASHASGPPSPPAAAAPPSPTTVPTALPTALPTPPLPAYYVESLRARQYAGGTLEVGAAVGRGAGFTRYQVTWPSGGQLMTGTMALPDGEGPFPVVIVNHGYIPASRYWVGQDSWIFGDPLAAHGFLALYPNWPGYAGSGAPAGDVPALVAETVATLDLAGALSSFPRADLSRLALIGHSNGGGIGLLAMVVDPRIKAVVLFAPVSSDMADNARKWWGQSGSTGGAGSPDSNPDGYRHLSPRNYFAAGQPPALILQGTADEDIPAEWTEATHDALAAAGVRSEVSWFPGAHHDMVGADLARANQLSEQWIRSALGL